MHIKRFPIAASIVSLALASVAPAAVVSSSAPASIALRTLVQSHGAVVAGPFTFDDFSLKVELSNGSWVTAPASVATAVTVRPVLAAAPGIELSGSVKASDDISQYQAFSLDYRLTSATVITGAMASLQATALNGLAGMTDSLIISRIASSGIVSHADTYWSSVGPAANATDTESTEFAAATTFDVSNLATVQPGDASVLAYAVDNVYVPEPAGTLLPVAGLIFIRRRRTVL